MSNRCTEKEVIDWAEHDDVDDEYDPDDEDPGDECGRWINGRLSNSCSKAGSEECDFECPYRNTLKF